MTDNDVLALVSAKLDAAARVEIDTHLDECAACRELVAAAGGKPDTRPHTLQFGRYAVLEQLGAEGNGVVYAAYDPQLDRRVLLKLLDASQATAPGQRERLLRDAKTMAGLSHPNVVQVHEAGELHGQVFITTALLDDLSLTEWLKVSRHPWEEVLRVFIQAGRGLAAIEAAGVHGDFQPDNVAVSDADGDAHEVRITEFGNFKNEFTKSARADQQSFAAALEKAFAGDARVPGRLRRILQKGRAVRPEKRFESLARLLDALESDPWVAWRRAGFLALAAAAAAGIVFGARWQANRRERACTGMGERLAGAWDIDVRARARAAFGASKLPFADQSWTLAEDALNRYASEWTAMRTEACEATAVRHQQPADLLELRLQCLDDRLASLGATSSLLAAAESKTITRAADLVAAIPPLGGCKDEAALRLAAAPSAAQKADVAKLRAGLAGLRARVAAGQVPVDDAKAAVFAAQQLGYPPLEADAQVLLGDVQEAGDDLAGALQTYTRGAALALQTKNDQALLDGWLAIVDVNLRLSQPDAAEAAAVQASAAATRMPKEPQAQGYLLMSLAYLSLARDRLDQAQSQIDQAVALLAKDPAARKLEIEALSLQSQTYSQRGLSQQAIDASERGLALAQELYGPNHPQPGQIEQELGTLLAQAGRLAEARPHLERSLAILEGLFGPDSPAVADALVALAAPLANEEPERALSLLQRALAIQRSGGDGSGESAAIAQTHYAIASAEEAQGKDEDALAELKIALAMQRKIAPDPDDLTTATFESELADVYTRAGKFDEARKLLEAALATQEKMHGQDEEATGDAVYSLARLELAQKHLAIAKKLCQRALDIARKSRPGESVESFDRELTLAEIELGLGEAASARPRLEGLVRRAAIPNPAPADPKLDGARARFLLAQALWDNPKERARAQRLIEEAQASYVSQGEVTADDRKVLQSWIAKH